jgi:adenylosuccinate synthase
MYALGEGPRRWRRGNPEVHELTPPLADLDRLAQVEVQYVTLPGWKSDITKISTWEGLPDNCKAYVKFIEDFLGVKIQYIGVGPARESSIQLF